MAKPKTPTGSPNALQRLTMNSPSVVTLNKRASRLLVFWANHETLVPVDAGWYIHAASMPIDNSPAKGESHLNTNMPFDLNDPKVRWEHVKTNRLARGELFLDTGRRYIFFITPDQSSPTALIRMHQPWPFQLRAPQAIGEPAILAFQVWPFEIDFHRDQSFHRDRVPKPKNNGSGLVGFDSWEHDSIAEMPYSGLSAQAMVDSWAVNGLIAGGAMIDTHNPFPAWLFWCPREDAATPARAYDGDPSQMGAKWHYVIPETQKDGSPWTPAQLSSAIKQGNAVALTIGHVILLAGDLFDKPEDMLEDADRWTLDERQKHATNIMEVYWEARSWRLRQLVGKTLGGPWQGYRQRYGVVYLVFELLLSLDEKVKSTDTIDEMNTVAQRAGIDNPQNQGDEAQMQWVFDHLTAKAKKVDAMVDLLILARGPSRYSEAHFLAHTLSAYAHGKGTTLQWISQRMPWIDTTNPDYHSWLDPQAYLMGAGFTQDEVNHFRDVGIDDMFAQMVVTNGRFATLAERNDPHFSDEGRNAQAFEQQHKKALESVAVYAAAPEHNHPLPSRSLLFTAFGCHFLTDAFSASHMRVPRTHHEMGYLSAKLMHDVDGMVGLWVHADDPPQIWYAFGDNNLHPATLSDRQRRLLLPHVDPDMNFKFVSAAVGSAFKQLHYQAHALWQTEPKLPGSSSLSANIRNVLAANGATDNKGVLLPVEQLNKATQLQSDSLSLGSAGPSRKHFWDHVKMTIAQSLHFMRGLFPHPLPPGATAATTIPRTIRDRVNIPPLFTVDPHLGTVAMNSQDGSVYDVVTGGTGGFKEHYLRGFTRYSGFSLRVYWSNFGDSWDDDAELRLDFDKYYFMAKFFKDVVGLEKLVDKTLLDVYENLPKEKW